jgi:hypothetical protein
MDFDTRRVTMIDADLPAFGEPTIQPDIPAATYIDRVAAARAAAAAPGVVGRGGYRAPVGRARGGARGRWV